MAPQLIKLRDKLPRRASWLTGELTLAGPHTNNGFLKLTILAVPTSLSLCGIATAQQAPSTTSSSAEGQLAASSQPTNAQEDNSPQIAKTLTNPIAALTDVPFQSNFDYNLGPKKDGFRYTLNIEPLVPFRLSPGLNLISRTVFPVIHQSNAVTEGTSQAGLGDTSESLWLSPEKPIPFVWGLGPVFLLPTGTNGALGSRKLSIGPTVVALKQHGGLTVGVLAFQAWSVAGSSHRDNVSLTFFQPFVSYTNKKSWTFGINTESSYDSVTGAWNVPLHPAVSKLIKFGGQPVSFQGALRCWALSPTGGPKDCGFRVQVTPVFPKKKRE